MTFTPRTREQILNSMIAYMQSRTTVSDYNVGSVVRSILEAAAMEDDEQYFQMVQLLDMFSFTTAAGEDLDRRLADFGLTRRSAIAATARGKFHDNNLIRTRAAADVAASSLSVTGFDTTRFPTSGYPYTIRVGEGTSRMQNLSVSGNNTSTMVLTLSAGTTYGIFVGDRVSFVTGGTLAAPVSPTAQARTLNIGTQVQAPPSATEVARLYTTTEPAYIVRGNYQSNEVIIKCTTSGTAGNIGANRINQFTSSPFSGAGFVNITKASGGLDRETDSEFRTRALEQLQSLSKGTPLAIKSAAIGVADPATQNRVTSSNIVEDFVNSEVFLYVDDGTGAIASTHILPSDSLSIAAAAGANSITPVETADWPNAGWVLIETDGTNAAELVQYTFNTSGILTLATSLTNAHDAGSIISFVDIISASAEATQRRFKLTNTPVVRNSERIFYKAPAGVWTQLTRDTDYIFNKGTGEFQLVDDGGVVSSTQIIAHYTYYTNLIAEVQKVMEGDVDDPLNYPGVKAAGIFLSVEQPIIKRVTVLASLTAASGFTESDLSPLVQRAIESYVSSLRIGQDVIVSKMIDVAFNITGVADIRIVTPTSNVIVLESELPIPFDGSGNSLIQVL